MTKISAAGIKIAKPASDSIPFERLKRLLSNYGSHSNKHEDAALIIQACIVEGIDTRPAIIAIMERLGFNRKHVAIMLEPRSFYSHHWRRSAEGIYSLTD